MNDPTPLAGQHVRLTRRYFLRLGTAGAASLSACPLWVRAADPDDVAAEDALAEEIAKLQYLTREEDFRNAGRGDPPPHTLPPEKLREVGLHTDTWKLEVVPDPQSNAKVENPLSEARYAPDWQGLMKLAETKAVRFMTVMTCTNGRAPFGMGLWEGVPLRDVIWMARPTGNVRRLFYYGYHNDDAKQRILLTNDFKANDTYAEWNNDTNSRVKTCARFLHVPEKIEKGRPVPISGVVQVGSSGLRKVQYWLCRQGTDWPADDPYFTKADWLDAEILPPPEDWGGDLPDGKLPPGPRANRPRGSRNGP